MEKKGNKSFFSFFCFLPSYLFFFNSKIFNGSPKELKIYEKWDEKSGNHRILGFEESLQTLQAQALSSRQHCTQAKSR